MAFEPYIKIEGGSKDDIESESFEKNRSDEVVIELNTAGTELLKKLKGIGDSYSNRIVKYRNLLGGFVKKEQLMEVYGMDTALYNQINDKVTVDASKIRKININKCSVELLKKHPYIKWNVASAIINYREQHGNFSVIADIKKTDLIDEDLFGKVAPYLVLQ